MAFILKDRVKENSTTTGTGNISLGGASATFDAFQSYLTNGDTTFYAIAHTSSGVDEWEVGLGTWNTGNTLSRTTILAGSNGTSAVNFSAGTKDIFMTYPASKTAVAGEDVTFADITVTGTVDGRDVAADGSKLDGIDTSADVTDAVTVAAAGALMRSGGTMTGNLILNTDPNAALGAATKQYVDTIASAGIHYHAPVRAEHPSNLNATYNNGSSGVGATLTNAGTNAALVIDSVNMVLNDRVLVANQTNQTQNGVYTVTTVGDGSTAWVLTRSTDTDTAAPSDPDAFGKGDAFFIKEGFTNAGHLDVLSTAGTIVFGTTNIVFSEVAETTVYSAGTGITLTGTTFSIGQDVATSANVTFNQVTADIIGNVTGNLTGDVTGNADTATALETARTIQLSGDVTGSASFDGSANINITAAVQDDSHAHVISNVDGLQSALNAKVPTSRTITAGNGLTGGGDLSANRTLNVGAGTGVTVNADTVAIGQPVETTSNVTFNDIRADGGNLILGDDALSSTSSYVGIKTSHQSGVSDYMIISGTSDGNTYVSAKDGNDVHIRGGGNNSTYEIKVYPNAYATAAGSTIITEAGSGLSKSSRTLSHADTSSQASVNNSNGTVIQDITLDTYGHITGINSFNLDGRYYTETEADSRFVNVTGDTMSGALTVSSTITATGNIYSRNGDNSDIVIGEHPSYTNYGAVWLDGESDYRFLADPSGGHTYINALGSGNIYFRNDNGTLAQVNASGTMQIGANTVFHDSYHPNADKWTTARTLSLSGDASGSVSWDGSANATLSVTVADDSHNHTISNIDNLSVGSLSGMRLTTTSGYIEFGPANASWAHIYTDRPNFYFNKELYVNSMRVYNTGYHPEADKWTTSRTLSLSGDASGSVSWDGSANATLSANITSINNSVTFDGGTSTTISIKCDDGGMAMVRANGDSQGTGALEVGQSNSYGGGISYNGDNSPAFVSGESADNITFYRLENGTRTEVFHYPYNSNTVNFNGSITLGGTVDGVDIAARDGVLTTTTNTANAALPKAGGTMTAPLTIDTDTSGMLKLSATNSGPWAIDLQRDDTTNSRVYNGGGYWYFEHRPRAAGNIIYDQAYHPEADKWTTARTLTLSGDASGSVSWDGSANATLSVTVANDSHSHSNYITSNANDTSTGTIAFGTGGLDPDSYTAYSGGFGNIADGGGWVARGVFVSGGTGKAAAMSSGSGNVYFGTQDGTNLNTMATWLRVTQSSRVADFSITPTVSGSTVWHAGNDGSGSGLDADTVDGVHESTFMRRSANSNLNMNNYEINYVNQVYFNDGVRFVDEGNDQYLRFRWNDTGSGGIKFYDGNDLFHGYVYGDGSGGFGLLDKDGHWFVYTNGTSETQLRANNNPELYVYTSYVYAPGSFRAPIFYDSDNTAYYTNPATYSKLNALQLGSSTTHTNNSTYALQIHDNNKYLASFRNSAVGGNYPWIVHDTYNSTGAFIIHFNGFSSDSFHFTQNGDGFAQASFRAPIFYDSNNTAYYADFAGTSVFNQINVTTLNSTSDIRFKSDLQKIDNAVDKLKTISGYTYMLKDHDDRKAGLIAQEVEAVLPEAIKGSEDKKLLDYQATIALLVEAVKEQSEEIAILKSRLIKLEN